MLSKASFRLLIWIAIAVLSGAVIWTVRRQETYKPNHRERQHLKVFPTRDGIPASRTKSTIRPSRSTPLGENDFQEQGKNAAKLGMETVSTRLGELTSVADKEAFIRGAFRYAASLEIKEALDRAWQLQRGHSQDTALMTLLCEWSGKTVVQWLGNPDFMSEGIAASLGNYLLKSGKTTPRGIAGFAWNFTSGRSRGTLIGQAAAMLAPASPYEAWEMGKALDSVEATIFEETFIRSWAIKDLPGMTRWMEATPGDLALNHPRAVLMHYLIQTNIQAAANSLGIIPAGSVNRRDYVTEIGEKWAMTDTRAALDWAETLPTPEDRSAALQSIQQMTPIGIGAAMIGNMISAILPDSPASQAGLSSGDRILALTNAEGQWIEAPGMNTGDLVKYIRGQANTNVTLRIQTKGGGTRNVTITRRQIMMKSQ